MHSQIFILLLLVIQIDEKNLRVYLSQAEVKLIQVCLPLISQAGRLAGVLSAFETRAEKMDSFSVE